MFCRLKKKKKINNATVSEGWLGFMKSHAAFGNEAKTHQSFSFYTTNLDCNSNLRQLRTEILVEFPSKKESDKIV